MATGLVVPPLGPVLGDSDELYLTFAECPHDELPPGYVDADDSLVEPLHAQAHEQALAVLDAGRPLLAQLEVEPFTAKAARRVIVPHPRDIKSGNSGADVLALQRALAAAHYRKWGNFTRSAGVGVVAEVKKFQHDHGIRATGIYNEATHRKLAKFYDAYGVFLLLGAQANSVVVQRRQRLLAAAMTSYNYRNTIHYTQGSLRWMMISGHIRAEAIPSQRSLWVDCSSWFTWLYWEIGCPDPNELNFTGGYTGTLGVRGKPVKNWSKAPVGVGFLYGPGGPWKHIQIGVGGENTIGCGSEAGPLYLPATYRGDLDRVHEYPGLS